MKRRYLPTVGIVASSLVAAVVLVRGFSHECQIPKVRRGFSCVVVQPPIPEPTPSPTAPVIVPPLKQPPLDIEARFSAGERILFTDEANPDITAGVEAISAENYPQAIAHFENAVISERNNPEPQIYLNNAIAQQQGNPHTIAVVVPVKNRSAVAKDILRGVADAQSKFNQEHNGRLLEVIIANDGNEKDIAAKVSERLVAMSEVLGVVGHNSSDASLAAFSAYETAGLSMISPTSSSTSLGKGVFFRTVPSDAETGARLADYVDDEIAAEKVAIFYDFNGSSYSRSLRDAFTDNFDGEIVVEVDLRPETKSKLDSQTEADLQPESLNYAEAISNIPSDVSTLLLFPSTDTVSRAIGIANANSAQKESSRFQLVGGDALYESKTLTEGGSAIEGLVLAVPWFANTQYAKTANERWGGRVSWRTASSYDATKVMTEALSANASRDSVLTAVRKTNLSGEETSGNPLAFELGGDRLEEPLLVQAVQGGNSPSGSKFGFELIE